MGLGAPAGALARLLSPRWQLRPAMTRSSVAVLARSCSVRTDKLERALGPVVRDPPAQPLELTLAYYRAAGWAKA